MKDGERKKCPIVPDEVIQLKYGDGEEDHYVVAAHADSIQIFPNSKYNYLRYWDSEDGNIRALFLSEYILAHLVDMGIPTSVRNSITETEHEAYQNNLASVATAGCVEIEHVPEEPEPHLTDAEIEWFWKEVE